MITNTCPLWRAGSALRGVAMFPKIILIDNFNGCNLRCSICDHKNMTRPIKYMEIPLYHKIIDEIAAESPESRVWQIYFGDPFLCRDMAERIKYAKDAGLKDVVLNSNGLAMTKERAERLIIAGLDYMYVGIDAATEETYNKIRIGGNFERTKANVLEYRKMSPNIFVQFVETEFNKHEKEPFIKFWNDRDISVKIRPMVSWIGLIDNGNNNPKQKTGPCYWYQNSMSILNSGDVSLCACDLHGRYIQGEVRTRKIKDVWTEMQLRDPAPCRTCKDWEAASAQYIKGDE